MKGRPRLAERMAIRNIGLGLLFMLPISCAFLIGAEWLARMLSTIPEVVERAAVCLRIGAVEIPFLLVTEALRGTLRGAGDTRSPFVVSLVGTRGPDNS